jgi:hypothetical protein
MMTNGFEKVEIMRDPWISDLNTNAHPHFSDLFHWCYRYKYPTVKLTITIGCHDTEIFMMQRQLICLILHGVTFRQIYENNLQRLNCSDKPAMLYNPLMGCCGEPLIPNMALVGVGRVVRNRLCVSHDEYPYKGMLLHVRTGGPGNFHRYRECFYSEEPLETQLLSILLHAKINSLGLHCESPECSGYTFNKNDILMHIDGETTIISQYHTCTLLYNQQQYLLPQCNLQLYEAF